MAVSRSQVAVRFLEGNEILEPWRFFPIDLYTSYTYGQLYQDVLQGKHHQFKLASMKCRNYTFEDAVAGTSLSMAENIKGDLDTDIVGVVESFGMRFVTICIEHDKNCQSATCIPIPTDIGRPNVFSVLMAAARNSVGSDVPTVIVEPKTQPQRLRNEVLQYFSENKCLS